MTYPLEIAMTAIMLLLAAMAGTWWVDDDLLRGILALSVMVLWTAHIGIVTLQHDNSATRRLFAVAFVTPLLAACIGFAYGFD